MGIILACEMVVDEMGIPHFNNIPVWTFTVTPSYYAHRYYADSDITQSVVDPEFLPPGENPKWACLNLLRIALTILKKH